VTSIARTGVPLWGHRQRRPDAERGRDVSSGAPVVTANGSASGSALFADPDRGGHRHSLAVGGGGLGYSGIPGIAVGLDTFQNADDPSSNFVAVSNLSITGLPAPRS